MSAAESTATRLSGTPVAGEAAGRFVALLRAAEGCSAALREVVEGLAARYELSATQLLALWVCGEAPGGLGQSELAALVGISAAQASALVEQLRRRDMLAPYRAAADRRRQHWSITAEGRNVTGGVAEALAGLCRHIETTLDAAELEHLRAALQAVAAAASHGPGGVDSPTAWLRVRWAVNSGEPSGHDALPPTEAQR